MVGSPVSRYSTDISGGIMRLSISFRTSSKMTSIKHNNRELTAKEFQEPAHRHIIQELSGDNLYLKHEDLKMVYDHLFGEALQEYNAKQKRKDRKIADFYHHVKKSKTLDLQREFIVGLGTKADWDNMSRQDKLLAGEKLAEYVREFSGRHPHLYVYNAAVHLDEAGAPHAHFNVVPIATGYKNGLKVKPSFKKALANEGYADNGRTLLKHFKDDEVKVLEEKLMDLGYQRKEVGTNSIKDLHEYKRLIEEFNQAEKELDERYLEEYSELHDLETKKHIMETMTIPQIESEIEEKKAESKQIDTELEVKRGHLKELSEKKDKQIDLYEQRKAVLEKQERKIKEIAGYDVQDYQSWQESQELVQELESASPKRFGGGFLFSKNFVTRLKSFVTTIVDKLNQARSQNNLLRRTVTELDLEKQSLKQDNQKLSERLIELKQENIKLRDANTELKGSERLLEAIQDVLTESEVESIGNRLDKLQASKNAKRRSQERNHGGPSL